MAWRGARPREEARARGQGAGSGWGERGEPRPGVRGRATLGGVRSGAEERKEREREREGKENRKRKRKIGKKRKGKERERERDMLGGTRCAEQEKERNETATDFGCRGRTPRGQV